eukprot:gene11572-4818_t
MQTSSVQQVKLQDSKSPLVYIPNLHYFYADEIPPPDLLNNSQFQITEQLGKLRIEKIEKGIILDQNDDFLVQKNGSEIKIEGNFFQKTCTTESEIIQEMISEFEDRNEYLKSLFKYSNFEDFENFATKDVEETKKKSHHSKRLSRMKNAPAQLKIPGHSEKVQPFTLDSKKTPRKGTKLISPMKHRMVSPYRDTPKQNLSIQSKQRQNAEKFSPQSPNSPQNLSDLPTLVNNNTDYVKHVMSDLDHDLLGSTDRKV